MEDAAIWHIARERMSNLLGEAIHSLVDTAGCGGIAAFYREECFGDRKFDLVFIERGDFAVTPYDAVATRSSGGDFG
jgi:hypothetical protein